MASSAISPEVMYLAAFSMVILMKIVCFILGYKIVKLGYLLVSSGVKGEFRFSANFIGFKSDLASLSPGLLFVLLGVLLMTTAIYINKTSTYQTTVSPKTHAVDSVKQFKDSTLTPNPKDF
jgi:hypothetical protein